MLHVRSIAVVATATTLAITGGVFVLAMMILVLLSGIFGGGVGMIMPLGGVLVDRRAAALWRDHLARDRVDLCGVQLGGDVYRRNRVPRGA